MSSASEDLQNIEKGSSLAPYPEKSDALSDPSDPFEVTLEQQDNPKALPTWRRWLAALIINAGAICVTGASSMVRGNITPGSLFLNAFPGRDRRTWRGARFSRFQRSGNTCRDIICRWTWHWTNACWAVSGCAWSTNHIYLVLRFVVRLHLAGSVFS